SRGKYTFVTSCACDTSAWVALFRVVDKKLQTSRPVKAKSEYGTPSVVTRAMRPKTSVKISIIVTGWTIAHARPRTDCLYRTRMRCALNVRSKSAYCASSPRSPVDRRTRAPARRIVTRRPSCAHMTAGRLIGSRGWAREIPDADRVL